MILKNSVIYFAGNVINKMLPFFIMPVLTHYISPEGYGVISILNIIMSTLTAFILINFNGALIQYCSSTKDNIIKNNFFLHAIVYTILNFMLVVSILFVGSFFYQFSLLNVNYNWIYIMAVISVSNAFMSLFLAKFQLNNQPYRYVSLNITYSVLNIGFSLLLIIGLSFNWEGRIIGTLISAIIVILLCIYFLYKNFKYFMFQQNIKTKLYNFGLPLIPHTFSGILIVSIDRFFINNMIGTDSVGIYSVAYQFGIIISIVSSSINLAWAPYFFRRIKVYSNKNDIIKKLSLIFVGLFISNLLIIKFSHLIVLNLLDEEYQVAINYIDLIAWGHFFEGLYIFVSLFVLYYKKNIYLSYFTATVLVSNTLLNYVFIPKYGVQGAALATLCSYILYFILVSIFSIYFVKKEKGEN